MRRLKGPSPGGLCGMLALLAIVSLSVLLVVDLVLGGTGPARRLQTEEDGDGEVHWAHLSRPIILAVILAGHCIGFPLAALYWRCFILPTHDKFIPQDAVIPEALSGRWKYGHWEFFGACGTCLSFAFCPCCTLSEYWYRAGHLHASSRHGPQHVAGCPGYQFFLGCCGIWLLQEAMCCCYVVGLAAGTGGLGFCSEDSEGSGMGSVVPFRQRYGLRHAGWPTFIRDCCCWLWYILGHLFCCGSRSLKPCSAPPPGPNQTRSAVPSYTGVPASDGHSGKLAAANLESCTGGHGGRAASGSCPSARAACRCIHDCAESFLTPGSISCKANAKPFACVSQTARFVAQL
ncbi:unnamed protein product [Symbiodinium microadriaticum]|nr:unnamed protein product [Symbiodinium microadriaticum]